MRLALVCQTRLLAVLVLSMPAIGGCAARPRMCVTPADCVKAACVAGRCQPAEGTPAILAARRVLVAPVDVAFVTPGDSPSSALPPIFTMGRAGSDGLLLLRFSVPLARDATIVEAYLLLSRSTTVDSDPTPISLHVTRIIDAWDPRSTTWASQPRTEEVLAPTTTVAPGGRNRVRLDVRDVVRRWRNHESSDQGIAVVAENTSPTGMPFALIPGSDHGDPSTPSIPNTGPASPWAAPGDPRSAISQVVSAPAPPAPLQSGELPVLELYIK